MEIIHSPGRSGGSLNILFKEEDILFNADSVPLKNDFPNYDNYKDLINSLSVIRNNDLYDVLLTSWTPLLSGSNEIRKLFDGVYMNEERIRNLKPINTNEAVSIETLTAKYAKISQSSQC